MTDDRAEFTANRDAGLVKRHEQRLARAQLSEQDAVHEDLRLILLALGLGDHARPYSSHEVVHREVLPAIKRAVGIPVHKPFPDDGVTYCGWFTGTQVIEGCGETWPCATIRAREARP